MANAARLRRWCVEQGVQIAYTAQPGSMTEEQRGRTVGHRHALGHAGGAGGVDHIGQVVAVQRHLWIMAEVDPWQSVSGRNTKRTGGAEVGSW